MAEPASVYVLDSFALLAYFQAESGGPAVLALVEAARDQQAGLHLSLINAGEMYYLVHRQKGRERAETLLRDLRELPILLEPVSEERVWAAARLKAAHAMSYSDAFAAALAQELNATLVTGDLEFKSVEGIVRILWLARK